MSEEFKGNETDGRKKDPGRKNIKSDSIVRDSADSGNPDGCTESRLVRENTGTAENFTEETPEGTFAEENSVSENSADDTHERKNVNDHASESVSAAMGGFFDSLIADFSLDELPAADNNTDGQPVVEVVDSLKDAEGFSDIVSKKDHSDAETADDILVLFDAEENISASAEDIFTHPEERSLTDDMPGDGTNVSNDDKKGAAKLLAAIFPAKGDSAFEVVRKIIFDAAVCVFVVSGVMLVSTLVQSKRAVEDKKNIESIVTTTLATTIVTNEAGEEIVETIAPTPEEEEAHNFSIMQYFKDQNPDVVGFLELEGCDIHEPVLQTDNNDYYLTHTYYKGENKAGSVFMDYRCTVSAERFSPNIVLYGHNQQDGTMFGNLKYFKNNLQFYKDNPFVKLRTDYGVNDYVIFAYFVTNTLERHDGANEVFHYQDYIDTLSIPSTFAWYLFQINKRSQILAPVDVEYGDELLVLSTCSNEYSDSRFVVIARKLRGDESKDSFDFSQAVLNDGTNGIDRDAVSPTPRGTVTYTRTVTVTVTEPPVSEEDDETRTAAPADEEEENASSSRRRRSGTSADESEESASESSRRRKSDTEAETDVPGTSADTSETTAPETSAASKTKKSAADTTVAVSSESPETSETAKTVKTSASAVSSEITVPSSDAPASEQTDVPTSFSETETTTYSVYIDTGTTPYIETSADTQPPDTDAPAFGRGGDG